MNAETKALPMLSVIHGLASHHGKKYCFPSQLKLMELVARRLGVFISIATLNRWLRVIEDAGYLRRIRRIRRDRKLGMVFQSTVYVLTWRGCNLLARQGVAVWHKMRELAAAGRKKLSPGSREKKSGVHAPEVFSLANQKKRHPGVKLPWNHPSRKA